MFCWSYWLVPCRTTSWFPKGLSERSLLLQQMQLYLPQKYWYNYLKLFFEMLVLPIIRLPAVRLPPQIAGWFDWSCSGFQQFSPVFRKIWSTFFFSFSCCCSLNIKECFMVNYEMYIIHLSSQNSSRNITLFSQDGYAIAVIVCIYIALVIPETLST